MRITIRQVLELLAGYPTREWLLADYPYLEPKICNKRSGTPPLQWMTS